MTQYDGDTVIDANNTFTVHADYKKWGTYGGRMYWGGTDDSCYDSILFDTAADIYAGGWFYISSSTVVAQWKRVELLSIREQWGNPMARFALYRQNAALDRWQCYTPNAVNYFATPSVTLDAWHWIEIRWLEDDTAGGMQAWVDGTELTDAGGGLNYDTATAADDPDRVRVGHSASADVPADGSYVWVDDVSADTSYIGPTSGGGGVTQELAGTIVAVAALTADLTALRALAGVTAAQATLTGVVQRIRPLGGAVVAASTLPGAATLLMPLEGEVAATATLTGAATALRALAGQIDAAGLLTGDASALRVLAGEIAGVSALIGNIEIVGAYIELEGTIVATSTLTGAVTALRALAGQADAVSTLTGATAALRGLAGSIDAAADLTGALITIRALGGSVDGLSTLAGALSQLTGMAGEIVAVSGLTGAFALGGYLEKVLGTSIFTRVLASRTNLAAGVGGDTDLTSGLIGGSRL